jgi:hypothetical protein
MDELTQIPQELVSVWEDFRGLMVSKQSQSTLTPTLRSLSAQPLFSTI